MELDPPATTRPILKRPHDTSSGSTPVPKRFAKAPPNPGSDEDEQSSPTATVSRRKKPIPHPTRPKKPSPTVPPTMPNAPSLPQFTMNVIPETLVMAHKSPTPTHASPRDDPFLTNTQEQSTGPDEEEANGDHEGGNDEPEVTTLDPQDDWETDPEASFSDMLKFIKAGAGTQMEMTTPTVKGGEWHIIRTTPNRPDLDHHSDNPYDFLPAAKLEKLIQYWMGEAVSPNDLTERERNSIGQPKIKKILVKVVCNGALDEERRTAWFRAATLSALAQSGADTKAFAKSRQAINMKKPGYSWIIVPVVLSVFKALRGVRGALDPRSGTLVLFRQWQEASFPTQHMYAYGIHRTEDNVPQEIAMADYLDQMKEALQTNKLEIQEMIPGFYGDRRDYGIKIKFSFAEGAIPFLISPTMLPHRFWTGQGNTKKARLVKYQWPPKCRLCESESHVVADCPWPELEVGNRKPNMFNCREHGPGWEEPQQKQKKSPAEVSTDFFDITPSHEKRKAGKETASKGKERAI